MKTVNLYLSTTSAINPPSDKSNLANVKWFINWKSIFDGFIDNNKIISKVKVKLITSSSAFLTFVSNIGTLRANFSSPFSNMSNGFTLGIPKIKKTEDADKQTTSFMGQITAGATNGTLNVFPIAPSEQRIQFTGNINLTTLTVSTANTQLPIGAIINFAAQTGNSIQIIAQTGGTTYTINTSLGSTGNQLMTATLQNNPIYLPIGSKIEGRGVPAETYITAVVGAYTYTVSTNTAVASLTPMITNTNYYYLELDTLETKGQSVIIPNNNNLNVQFFTKDEQTLMSNIPEYQLLLSFDVDEED